MSAPVPPAVTPAAAASAPPFLLDRYVQPGDLHAALAADVRRGLSARVKQLPAKWFYDAAGSRLFDEITRLPEYYPTRAERAILAENAPAIARATRAGTLVELGSGTSEKTRLLLDALVGAGSLTRFVPFDVDESVLVEASRAVAAEYPGLSVHAVVGDFERHLPRLGELADRPEHRPALFAFLGSTIGNLRPSERAAFWAGMRAAMKPGDALLLGTDLVKAPERLIRAYDDQAGITAEFNRNVLRVINAQLGGDFVPTAFDHVAYWDSSEEWMEMRLRARTAQHVRITALDMDVYFEAGEQMRTEISAKFRRETVARELAQAGLDLRDWYTDEAGDFAVTLAVREEPDGRTGSPA